MERSEAVRLAKQEARRRRWLLGTLSGLFVVAVAVRVYCAISMKGYLSDQQYFLTWMKTVDQFGLGRAYSANTEINYPPLLLALLWVYKQLLDALQIAPTIGGLTIKLPSLLFDIAAMTVVLIMTRNRRASERIGFFALFALNPVFILDGAVWGQVDMLHSLLLLGAIWQLPTRPGRAGILFALACLAKFQSVALAPVFAAYLLRRTWETNALRALLFGAAGFAMTFGGALVYFAVYGDVGGMLHGGYGGAVGLYPYVTLNAMNLWYYAIGTPPDALDSTLVSPHVTLRMIGFGLLGLAALATAVYTIFGRRDASETVMKAGAFAALCFFMLPTEIHERYIMPAVVLAILAAVFDPVWRRPALLLTLSAFFNMMMPFTGVNPYQGMGLVWLNGYVLGWMAWQGYKECRPALSDGVAAQARAAG